MIRGILHWLGQWTSYEPPVTIVLAKANGGNAARFHVEGDNQALYRAIGDDRPAYGADGGTLLITRGSGGFG